MITATRNRYFICLGQGHEPIPWDPSAQAGEASLDTDYFGNAFLAMEDRLEGKGWTVYLTWDLRRLPSYGDDVVAVVLGDEWGRIPRYAHRVATVFKCYGFKARPAPITHGQSFVFQLLVWLKYFYGLLKYLPGWVLNTWQSRQLKRPGHKVPAIYNIPLGYANQEEVEHLPFENRSVDISFAGSIQHKAYPWWSPKKWLGTPKRLSRQHMVAALQHVDNNNANWSVDLRITPSFRSMKTENPAVYAARLMRAKIAIVPRGNALETFRFFEAMRAGCVLITEQLPDFWFYHGAPVVRVSDWSQLQPLLENLLSDPEKLRRMHFQSRGWWRDVCSPQALGRYMAHQLNRLNTGNSVRKPDRKPVPLQSAFQHKSEEKNSISN